VSQARTLTPKGYSPLLAYLKAKAMTQVAFAAAVGINQSYASRIINRRGTPTLQLAIRIHALTGVPFESLIEIDGQEDPHEQ
jgi:transcriptional regulator with XRE-family HTH domain